MCVFTKPVLLITSQLGAKATVVVLVHRLRRLVVGHFSVAPNVQSVAFKTTTIPPGNWDYVRILSMIYSRSLLRADVRPSFHENRAKFRSRVSHVS